MRRLTREGYVGKQAVVASFKTFDGCCRTHWHEYYEIEFFTGGSGTYEIDGVSRPIVPGMLFFMTPLNFHQVTARDGKLYNVMFSEQLCEPAFLSALLAGGYVALQTDDSSGVFFRSVMEELVRRQDQPEYAAALLNTLLGKMVDLSGKRETHLSPAARGLLYLINHFQQGPTLAQTAAHVGYTPTYFSTVFRQETGESYQQCLDRLRFDYAEKLAKYSDLTAQQIARECGFSDYPNFLRRFKSRFGLTFTQLRAQSRQA